MRRAGYGSPLGRFSNEEANSKTRVVLVGDSVFGVKIEAVIGSEENLEVVAVARTAKDALAFPTQYGAEILIVDVGFGGTARGIEFARVLNERNPGCAFMLVFGAFAPSVAKHLWVFGTDSWSIVSQATAQNAQLIYEAINSTVSGIRWVEPGIQREMERYGPRPKSVDERKLAILDQSSELAG